MKLVKVGERIPYGLSKSGYNPILSGRTVQLMFPVIKRKCRKYDIAADEFRSGWWIFNILLRFEVFKYSGFGFKLHYGWAFGEKS